MSNIPLYQRLRDHNQWTQQHLPNAEQPFRNLPENLNNRIGAFIQRGFELILSSSIGDRIEQWEYQRKIKRFQQQAQAPTASAQIDADNVKGHFNDYGHPVLIKYYARLKELDLTETYTLESVGD